MAAAFGGAYAHSSSISSLEKAQGMFFLWVAEVSLVLFVCLLVGWFVCLFVCLFVYQPHQQLDSFLHLQSASSPLERVYQNAGGEDAGRLEDRSH